MFFLALVFLSISRITENFVLWTDLKLSEEVGNGQRNGFN